MKASWIIGGSITVVILAAGLVLPGLARPTNCGGNSAALTACKSVYLGIRVVEADRGEAVTHLCELFQDERELFRHIPGMNWIRGAQVLVRTNDLQIGLVRPRQIIVLCDKAYDNVPRLLFGKAPSAHAVCYSDGETGLISPSEFRSLDLRHFTDVTHIAN